MYVIYICYNWCKIASLLYIIVYENNSGLENDASISRKSNMQIDRCTETDAWAHLKWANLLGAVGRNELKVPVSRKMQWPVQARWVTQAVVPEVEWFYHQHAATATICLGRLALDHNY